MTFSTHLSDLFSVNWKQQALMWCLSVAVGIAQAQTTLPLNTSWETSSLTSQDLIIPTDATSLSIVIKGGDGGRVQFNGGICNNKKILGGEGATVSATFVVGNQSDMLKPGGRLRVFTGQAGGVDTHACIGGGNYSGGGGGSTAVLYLPPGSTPTPTAAWDLLTVAGGGGGANRPSAGITYKGKGANTEDCGDNVQSDIAKGGKNMGIGSAGKCADYTSGAEFGYAGGGGICGDDDRTQNGRSMISGYAHEVDQDGKVLSLNVNLSDLSAASGMGGTGGKADGGDGFAGGAAGAGGGGGGAGSSGGAGGLRTPGGGGGSWLTQEFQITESSKSSGGDGAGSGNNGYVQLTASLVPEAICKSEVTVNLDDSGSGQVSASDVDNGSLYPTGWKLQLFDNASSNLWPNPKTFTCSDAGKDYSVQMQLLDDSDSFQDQCSSVIKVRDATAPQAWCVNPTLQLNNNGQATLTTSMVNSGSSDNCGGSNLTFALSQTNFSCTDAGQTREVTLTARDAAGNSATCKSYVKVEDKIAPVLTCPASSTIADARNASNPFTSFPLYTPQWQSFTVLNTGALSKLDIKVENFLSSLSSASIQVELYEGEGTLGRLLYSTTTSIDGSEEHIAWKTLFANQSIPVEGGHKYTINIFVPGSQPIFWTVTRNTYAEGSAFGLSDLDYIFRTEVNAPNPIPVFLDAEGQASISVDQIDNGSTDNCGISSRTLSQSSFGCSDVGDQAVTLTITDNSGNSSSCQAVVRVEDNLAPVAKCMFSIVEYLDNNGQATTNKDRVDFGSYDNCSGELLFDISKTIFTCADDNTYITTTITDVQGNQSTCRTLVRIQDNLPPTGTCKDITVQLDEHGAAVVHGSSLLTDLYDNYFACDDQIFAFFEENGRILTSNTTKSFDCSNIGINQTTVYFSDFPSNVNSCVSKITVEDNSAPIVNCESSISIELDASGSASIHPNQIDKGSTDNCGIANLSLNQSSFDCSEVGSQTVTLTVTDVSGNTSSCDAIVNIEDNTAPIASCRAPNKLDAQNTLGSDLQVDIAATWLQFFTPQNTGPLSQIDILLRSLSGTIGRSLTINLYERVGDSFDLLYSTNKAVTLSTTDVWITLFSGESIPVVSGHNYVFTVKASSTYVLWGISEPNDPYPGGVSNYSDRDFQFRTYLETAIQLNDDGEASITIDQIDNGSTDACGIAERSLDISDFNCQDVGDNTVVLTVTDVNGNTSSCEASVSVLDEIAPTMACADDLVVLTDTGECGAEVSLPKAVPNDNCGIKSLKSRYRILDNGGNPVGGWSSWADDHSGFFELGFYEIQWRAKDDSDNKVFCSYLLEVKDEEAPEVICKDITVNFNGEEIQAIDPEMIFDANNSFDACGNVSFVSQSISEVGCEEVGEVVEIQVLGVDPNGNTNTCMAQVTVAGMPCGFTGTDVDCPNGAAAEYDPSSDTFTLSANDCDGYPDGEYSFVGTNICGDTEIIARVASLQGDGRAGVIMMENTAAGAKFVSIVKDFTPRVRTEYRSSTNGSISHKNKNRSGIKWLRIVRNGNKFKTYTSTNGSYWNLAHSINFPSFADCIQVGIITYSKHADQPVTAVFEQLSISGDHNAAFTQLPSGPGASTMALEEASLTKEYSPALQLEVAPNPFAVSTQISFDLPEEAQVNLQVFNLHGQLVRELETGTLPAGPQQIQWDGNGSTGQALTSGLYLVQLRLGQQTIVRKVALQRR